MAGRLRWEQVAGPAAADHILLRDDRDFCISPRREPYDVGEIVDQVRGYSSGPQGPDCLDAMMPIQDHELAIGHENRPPEVSVLPDLVHQLLEERRSDSLVAAESADFHDLKSDARRSPRDATLAGHRENSRLLGNNGFAATPLDAISQPRRRAG